MSIPADWIKWIAENTLLGGQPAELRRILLEAGFNDADITHELNAVAGHPYLAACNDFLVKLRKREWLLLTLSDMYKRKEKYAIERIPLPPFKDFLRDYYDENRPVIFTQAVDHWPAKTWTPDYLKGVIGSREVEVQSGRTRDKKYEENREKFRRMMPFDQFIDEVTSLGQSNDIYMTANNINRSHETMQIIFPDIGNIGDGYLDMKNLDKQCYVWVGPAGTLTPLHHDLTNNLFVQIYGRKRFLMIPACEVPLLYNERHVYADVDAFAPDYQQYPRYRDATVMDFILHPGETLFIPIGWCHAVEALDISISISFTNFNAFNNYAASYSDGMRY